MREEQASETFELAMCGGLYGFVLCVIGLLAAGAGHGTSLPVAVFSAPLGAVLGPLGLLVCLAWWPLVGFTLGGTHRPWVPATLLLLHASTVVAMLLFGTPFESAEDQWRYYERARLIDGAVLFTGWVIYVAGQAMAWSMVLVRWVSGAGSGVRQ